MARPSTKFADVTTETHRKELTECGRLITTTTPGCEPTPRPPHTLDRNSQYFEQEVRVPAGHATFHGDALLAIDLL